MAFQQAVEAIGDGERAGNVLLDDDDRDAARLDRRDDRVEVVNDHWGETEADLVAQKNAWIGQQAAAERHHLLLPAGQQPGFLPAPLFQHREELPDGVHADLAPAADFPAEIQVFFHRQRGKQPPALRHHGNTVGDNTRRRAAREVAAGEADAAFDTLRLSDDRFQQCRFAGAVGTDNGDDFTGIDVQIDLVHRLERIIENGQTFGREQRRRVGHMWQGFVVAHVPRYAALTRTSASTSCGAPAARIPPPESTQRRVTKRSRV